MKKIIVFLFLVACTSKPSEKALQTQFLQEYLWSNFHLKIPEELHYYLLVPQAHCMGCTQEAFYFFDLAVRRKDVTLITSLSKIATSPFAEKNDVHTDTTDTLDHLALTGGVSVIVRTKHQKIDSIFRLEIPSMQFLEDFMKR